MKHCLNPACPAPENPNSHQFCQSCGAALDREFVFRDRYRVVQLLGQGGFGRTYRAEDLECLNRSCVIKKLIAQGGKAAELFEREATGLYHLGEHSQIPMLYASFPFKNSVYLVQQFVEGANLLEEYQARGRFREAEILALLHDLLPVLQYVHDRKVLHRDIKPENIMRRKSDGKLVLIDFGGAKQTSTTMQGATGTRLYTPGYVALEQVMGKPNRTSDLYSLAATCVRLLTGCFLEENAYGDVQDELYDASTFTWQWREVLQGQGRNVSDRLGQVLDRMLEKTSTDRYQSAEEVLKALLQSSVAPPPPQPPDILAFSFETVRVNDRGRIIERQNLQAQYFLENLGNEVNLEMVAIPGGDFLMGAAAGEEAASSDEYPQHRVTVPPFLLGKYPVTQAQWRAVAKLPQIERKLELASFSFKGDDHPVEQVSWYDAIEFCARLAKYTGWSYRLPSEAEWEYACRAGTQTPFYFGETINTDLANYDGNYTYASAPKGKYRQQTTPVGTFPPNAFGLYDMHGNVWEWCADPWHDNYKGAPNNGKVWDEKTENDYQNICDRQKIFLSDKRSRVLRGGSSFDLPRYCRSALRVRGYVLDILYDPYGFRVACGAARTS